MKARIEKIKAAVRGIMFELAKLLDSITGGYVRAWHITLLSFAGHIFVLLALSQGMLVNAAILLIGFGILDALDGAIAKYQGTSSLTGMLLDSTSDRLKETLVFAGLAYYFASQNELYSVAYSVVALGLSFAVSYVKAKGETAWLEGRTKKATRNDVNREFEDGIFGYEIRMLVLAVSLVVGLPEIGVIVVASGALLTFMTRFNAIVTRLK